LTEGSYCLGIVVGRLTRIRVGALGEVEFTPGRYLYVGSALNGLEQRVKRHAATSRGEGKATHWHIDYLLKAPNVKLEAAYVIESKDRVECQLSSSVAKHGAPVPRFGCSDCKCGSHLYRVDSFSFLAGLGLRVSPLLT
jgi:Uri superfamily endonuclease